MHHDISSNYKEELSNTSKDDSKLSPEDLTKTPEKKALNRKKKLLAGAAIFLAIGCFGGGIATTMTLQNHNAAASKPTIEASQLQPEKDKAIPEEAKNFMKTFGDRFSDPMSTYYAGRAYEDLNNGAAILLSDEYINSYKITYNTSGDTSELGFTKLNMKFDKKMDQAGSMDVFNNYISVNLDNYMNMIAKNPGAKAKAVLDCQFLSYCENMDSPDIVNVSQNAKLVDVSSNNLLKTINSVVSKYGSAANYKIAPASHDDTKKDVTLFTTPTHALVNLSNNLISGYQDNSVRLVIDVDIYKDKEVSHVQEVIEGVQLNVKQRVLGSTQVSFGQN